MRLFHGDPSVEGFSHTFEYIGAPGDVAYEMFTFDDLGGEGYDKLDEVLEAL